MNHSEWLACFASDLKRGDIAAAAAGFHETTYWRDLVAFTWNIVTFESRSAIADSQHAGGEGCRRDLPSVVAVQSPGGHDLVGQQPVMTSEVLGLARRAVRCAAVDALRARLEREPAVQFALAVEHGQEATSVGQRRGSVALAEASQGARLAA